MDDFDGSEPNAAASYLRQGLREADCAKVLVIAGSGLGGFVASFSATHSVNYEDIPGVGDSTVAGHAGKLLFGRVGSGDKPLLVMAGRRHLYEGLTADEATRLPRAILEAFPNLKTVIVSNAAGGLNPSFAAGDLMLISDHINLMFQNPLIGLNRDDLGPRFPDLSDLYSESLREHARRVALALGIPVREGVYAAMHGPSYETRAELAMLRFMIGADAVGMSTVPEALVMAHGGCDVLGISFISNVPAQSVITSHEEVMGNAHLVEERFSRLIMGLIDELE